MGRKGAVRKGVRGGMSCIDELDDAFLRRILFLLIVSRIVHSVF